MAAMVLLLILFAFFGLAVPLGMGKLTAGKTAVLAEEREQWQTMLEDYLGGLSELKKCREAGTVLSPFIRTAEQNGRFGTGVGCVGQFNRQFAFLRQQHCFGIGCWW